MGSLNEWQQKLNNQQLGSATTSAAYPGQQIIANGGGGSGPYTTTTTTGNGILQYPGYPPYPTPPVISTEMFISLITLMYTVGPVMGKRLIKKFELAVDKDILNTIADGIKQLSEDSNDNLDEVVKECVGELKI